MLPNAFIINILSSHSQILGKKLTCLNFSRLIYQRKDLDWKTPKRRALTWLHSSKALRFSLIDTEKNVSKNTSVVDCWSNGPNLFIPLWMHALEHFLPTLTLGLARWLLWPMGYSKHAMSRGLKNVCALGLTLPCWEHCDHQHVNKPGLACWRCRPSHPASSDDSQCWSPNTRVRPSETSQWLFNGPRMIDSWLTIPYLMKKIDVFLTKLAACSFLKHWLRNEHST